MSASARILGVDDNPRNLAILRKSLAPEFELVTASSGEEAIEIASHVPPDLVLLDIMMPGIDGYETCRRLRAMRGAAGAKIILISAKSRTEERIEGYAAGADDYLVKPFDPDELLAKTRVYLRLKRVEEIEHMKSDLLSLMSHEVRTPLTCLVGPLEILAGDETLSQDHRELVDMMSEAARRLTRLADQVSYLVGFKAGAIPVEREMLPLSEVVNSVALRMQARAAAAGVRLEVAAGAGDPAAACDPEHLARALDVLLENAIRFSPAGGTVRVWTEADGTGARLLVSDEGPGVPAELKACILEEFAVTDIVHHQSGLGLGLATARTIVEHHGGRLRLVDGGEPGATFAIELPGAECLPDDQAAREERDPTRPTRAAGRA